MRIILLNGFYLLKHIFAIEIPEAIEIALKSHQYHALSQTINYWNSSKLWTTPIPRLKYERILLRSQDIGFKEMDYFMAVYSAYTKPRLVEPKRFIIFPEKYRFLNFLSKVFSYLVKKTFGIK